MMNTNKSFWAKRNSTENKIEKKNTVPTIVDSSNSTESLGFSSDEFNQYIESLSILTNIYIRDVKANIKNLASQTFQNKSIVRSLNELASIYLNNMSTYDENDFLSVVKFNSSATPKVDYLITIYLEKIGIPAHMKGRDYLKEAIITVINDSSAIHKATKTLYPSIATKFSTTSTRVERSIRHAIETAWNRGDFETQQMIFGDTLNSHKDKPTNIEFIATVSEKIRLEYDVSRIAI